MLGHVEDAAIFVLVALLVALGGLLTWLVVRHDEEPVRREPRYETRVMVLNATPIPVDSDCFADCSPGYEVANVLRGQGYSIAGYYQIKSQGAMTLACRPHESVALQDLARRVQQVLGRTPDQVPFDNALPANIQPHRTDCIIVVGTDSRYIKD